MDIVKECEAYEVIKDLITSGNIQYYSQLKDITGYENDIISRVCYTLYQEGYIGYFLIIKKLEY